MHILHTVLYTFPKVLTRRICQEVFQFMIIYFILVTLPFDSGFILHCIWTNWTLILIIIIIIIIIIITTTIIVIIIIIIIIMVN